jgi:hypothetical protein
VTKGQRKDPAKEEESDIEEGDVGDYSENEEEDNSPFDDKADVEDGVDVPVGIVAEHVIQEGCAINGITIEDDGSLARPSVMEAEEYNTEGKKPVEDEGEGRGKQIKYSNR